MLRYWIGDDDVVGRVWYFYIPQIATLAWNAARLLGKVFGLYGVVRINEKHFRPECRRYPVCLLIRRYTSATGILAASHLISVC